MFSGTWSLQKQADGSYFIDRDGTHFRYIINYLRGQQVTVPLDNTVLGELLEEVIFYNLEELFHILNDGFKPSNILTKEMSGVLCSWKPFVRPRLAYNVSKLEFFH